MREIHFPQSVIRFRTGRPIKQDGRKRPIAFVHIPKTAGTSFTRYLRSHYRRQEELAPPFFGDFESIKLDNPECRLYCGHFTYAQFKARRNAAWFITFLRRPVDRIISQYKSYHNPDNVKGGWKKAMSSQAREALNFSQRATFAEFVMSDHPEIVRPLQDLQTRFLSDHDASDHPKFLTSAIENLESSLLFFGLSERFSDSIQLFRMQLGTQKPYSSTDHVLNVSAPYSINMSDRVRQRINDLTRNDDELYRRACMLFESRWDQLNDKTCVSAA